ncbi:hypothetical protein, partial [Prevotella pallens]|uniref:hypothetical protein n=1 Tax=Prevotella pallens TaxID=60133 RepID=UPI0028F041AA
TQERSKHHGFASLFFLSVLMYEILRIATPFCGCSWVRYEVLQRQWWKIATPFCAITWVRAR